MVNPDDIFIDWQMIKDYKRTVTEDIFSGQKSNREILYLFRDALTEASARGKLPESIGANTRIIVTFPLESGRTKEYSFSIRNENDPLANQRKYVATDLQNII